MKRGAPVSVLLLALAGCRPASPEAAPSTPASAGKESLLVRAGGAGPSSTQPFEMRGNRLRVKYKLTQRGTVSFTAERMLNDTEGSMAARKTEPDPDLSGQVDIPLVPGRYRLSVDATGSWTAQLFDVR